jgi:FKBP-type peptidyl-prolyl cis-trans isomerase
MYLKSAMLSLMLLMTIFSFAQKDEKDLKRQYERDSAAAAKATFEMEEEILSKVSSEDNKRKGEAFLAKNKTMKGVITLPSGLQYKILKNGKGAKPTEADTVQVHYRGSWINNVEFYNSKKFKKPVSLAVKKVIPGWKEALKLMRAGSTWQLFIPPELAYGQNGLGAIAGNTVVIYEIEFFGINPSEKPEEKTAASKLKESSPK